MERLGRVRDATAADLQVRNLQSVVLADREPAHLHALLGIGHGAASMRRLSGRDQQHTLEAGTVDRGAGRRQVTCVDGVECAAEDADPHGWYSNSTPAMLTVSPGSTPAASSAVLTPNRSSSAWNRASPPSESRLVRSTRRSTRSPRTTKPDGFRSTTSSSARRTGSLVTFAGAGTGGSGPAATTPAIASIRRGRPSPVRAETKYTPARRERARSRRAGSRSTLFTATICGRFASPAENCATSCRTVARSCHGSDDDPSST